MPANQRRLIDDMPTKNMDKDEAYRHPKIKALSKELQKLPLRTVRKLYTDLSRKHTEIVEAYLGEKDPEKRKALAETANQVNSAWRATNDAYQTMHDEAMNLDDNPKVKYKYLPRSEIKKRTEVPHDLRDKIKQWMAPKRNDPLRGVVEEMRTFHGLVPHAKVDKAIEHLTSLADDPHHADDKDDILQLRDELAKATGRSKAAHDLMHAVIRLAHERPDLRAHLLPVLREAAASAAQRYEANRREADRLLREIGTQLAQHERRQKADPLNWGYAGDMAYIVE